MTDNEDEDDVQEGQPSQSQTLDEDENAVDELVEAAASTSSPTKPVRTLTPCCDLFSCVEQAQNVSRSLAGSALFSFNFVCCCCSWMTSDSGRRPA